MESRSEVTANIKWRYMLKDFSFVSNHMTHVVHF